MMFSTKLDSFFRLRQTFKAMSPSVIMVTLVLASGCAAVPSALDYPEDRTGSQYGEAAPSVSAVRSEPEQFENQWVRWGGTIVGVQHESDHTLVEIVSRPIASNARPVINDQSDGRFLARIDGFLESGIYSPNRELTVVGTVSSVVQRPIGKANYDYPVVAVEKYHLWQERRHYDDYEHGLLAHGRYHHHSWHDDFFYGWPFGYGSVGHGHWHRGNSIHGHIEFRAE